MWGLVCVWVSFPEGSYGGLWLTGAFILLSLIAGAKLHIIAMHLARHAYSRFYKPYSRKSSKQEVQSASEEKQDAVLSSGMTAAGPVGEAVEGLEDEEPAEVKGGAPAGSKRVPLRRLVRGHSQRIKGVAEDEELMKLFWFKKPRHMLRVFRCAAAAPHAACQMLLIFMGCHASWAR